MESCISRKGQIGLTGKSKSHNFTDKARVFARELYDAGLLSEEGLRKVEMGKKPIGDNKTNH